MIFPNFSIFGDSHVHRFSNFCSAYSYTAASCRGLNNKESKLKVGHKIIKILQNIDLDNQKCIFMFGNVDIIFNTVYFYNKQTNINLLFEYLDVTISKYQNFIEKIIKLFPQINLTIFGVYPYEFDEIQHLNFCSMGHNYHNIMNHIDSNPPKFYIPKFVPSKDTMIQLVNIFNEKMLLFCEKKSIGFYNIEHIPNKYMNKNRNDHHFNEQIIDLWYPIFEKINVTV
tara:strand:+ start:2163 stop:2843 length:681 start_codon:yes stop_codon:yes gene_type:complete